jgi:hypothetical protein
MSTLAYFDLEQIRLVTARSLSALLLPFVVIVFPARLSVDPNRSGDDATLRRAAAMLQNESPRMAVSTLQQLRRVARADVGIDGRTVDITFRDGQQAAILPSSLRSVPVHLNHVVPRLHVDNSDASLGRALVAEPFATELSLGAHAGDVEAKDLQYAGFQVDQIYDDAVTIETMRSLAQYNVVYMLTHSGVNKYGEGVVATGQLATGDPTVEPLVSDGSVLKVGVAGSSELYYGILSHFVTAHMSEFAPHSLIFLNGCMLLRGTVFWQALQAKGASVLLSWDNNGLAKDDTLAAGAFFGEMIHGKTVSDAVSTVLADGYGVSTSDQQTAKLGYVGDGSITLAALLPSPTPTATLTQAPTTTPTATPSPVPTSRPVPLAIRLIYHRVVAVGRKQVITAQTAAGARVSFTIRYPNGHHQHAVRIAQADGHATYSFVQQPGLTRPDKPYVSIQARASLGSKSASIRAKYEVTAVHGSAQ